MDEELFEGTIRYTSSAYFLQVFPGVDGCKSEAKVMNAVGPMAEPWTTPALMDAREDVWDWNLVKWV